MFEGDGDGDGELSLVSAKECGGWGQGPSRGRISPLDAGEMGDCGEDRRNRFPKV
jgi:hypothetical protein